MSKTKRLRLIVALIVVITLIFLAFVAPFIVPYDPYDVQTSEKLLPISQEHLLGTDELGRDEFSRILIGLQPTLLAALTVVLVSMDIGTTLGVLAGYFGGVVDRIIMWLITTFNAFPSFLLAIVVAGLFGAGLRNAVIALVVVYWTTFARLGRGLVAQIKQENYVRSALLSGCNSISLLLRHIAPNALPQLLVTATSEVGSVILAMSGLSFLGLASQRPTAEWGIMLSGAQEVLRSAPQLALYASIAIVIVVLVFNLFGDALRDYLDHKQA